MLILYLLIVQGGFEVLNAILQVYVYVTDSTLLLIKIWTTVRKLFNVLSVVELLIKDIFSFSGIKPIHLVTNP